MKELNGQNERYLGSVSVLTHVLRKSCDMPHKYRLLAIRHVPYLKNRLPSAALGGRSPHESVCSYPAPQSSFQVIGFSLSAWAPPKERTGKLWHKVLLDRYIGHIRDETAVFIIHTATDCIQ